MIKNLNEKTHNLGNFVIVCRKCDSLGRGIQTNFHISYEKKYSVFICDICNAMEVFNFQGQRVTEKFKDKLNAKEEQFKN